MLQCTWSDAYSMIECTSNFVMVSKHLPGIHSNPADTIVHHTLRLKLDIHRPSKTPVPLPCSFSPPSAHNPQAKLDLNQLGKSVQRYYLQGPTSPPRVTLLSFAHQQHATFKFPMATQNAVLGPLNLEGNQKILQPPSLVTS